MAVTKDEIVRELRELGLRQGDCVLTHSSLSSFGHVEGGANAVIDAIIEAVGPAGTILFPTLTGSEELSPENPPYLDVLGTACWTGRIPETARNRADFARSAHPTHSVCACGDRAQWFVQGHEFSPTPCGVGSPYDKLVQAGGYILLIGVTHRSNTTMHHVEELAEMPYHMQSRTAMATVKYPDGRVAQVPVTLHRYGTPRDFTRLEPEFLECGIQVNGRIGGSAVRLVRAREMVQLVLERIKKNPTILLLEGSP